MKERKEERGGDYVEGIWLADADSRPILSFYESSN